MCLLLGLVRSLRVMDWLSTGQIMSTIWHSTSWKSIPSWPYRERIVMHWVTRGRGEERRACGVLHDAKLKLEV